MSNPDIQGTPPPVTINDSEHDHFRHAPIRVAIFSAVLLPMVLVPYLLTVRRTRTLTYRINELQSTTRALQRELDGANLKLSARKVQREGIEATLRDVVQGTNAIKHQLAGLAAENGTSRRNLDKLLAEAQHSRTQTAALRALGSSLADIAAFMHETELQMGIQPLNKDAQRRVDRLRITALRLQNLTVMQQSADEEQAKAAVKEKRTENVE
ncbi:hypothetical protein APHAL10511_002117 [Amanita phalloides]|nr:hypothetical protein APHAL10511_002117 [Amanita phalloides]